ncbi:hypothetical protein Ndes2526B_g09119 [Nannochloris sp. 'desiccata']
MKLYFPRSPSVADLGSHIGPSSSLPISFFSPNQHPGKHQRNLTNFSGNGGSTRVPKDPKAYADIEELRRELEDGKGQAPFTLTRTIKWLSDAANNGGGGLAFQAYRWVLGLDTPPKFKSYRRPAEIEATALLEIEETTDPELIEAIQTLLMIPKTAAVRLIYRCPAAGNMSSIDLMMRIVDLKGLFPGTNVARMVELLPTAFLAEQSDQWKETIEKLRRTSELLREGLQGANVDAIFEADPTILFESPESIELGLKRMKELWKVDAIALKNSEPEELALAVRALSLQGPPKSV